MVDNAISPSDLQNKALSSELHILTTTSNSGWMVPHDAQGKSTLINMTTEGLGQEGMKTGLVIGFDKEIGAPTKILPNKVPEGFDRISAKGEGYIKSCMGVSDAEQGLDSPEVSGIAIGLKQFQGKLQLADPLDNLKHTRTLVGRKIVELAQDFIIAERMFKVTGMDKRTGQPTEEILVLNQVDEYGQILNDITLGEYEVEVSTSPLAATFEEGQFKQATLLRGEIGVAIPDDELIRLSNLDNKYELAERLGNPDDGGVNAAKAKLIESQVSLNEAKRSKEIAQTTNTNVQGVFGAINAAKEIALLPAISPLADEILLSSGYEDANAAPLVPSVPGIDMPAGVQPSLPPTVNSSPNFPPQADQGAMAGIEGGMS
jgi:predicted nucleic acid-binding protein